MFWKALLDPNEPTNDQLFSHYLYKKLRYLILKVIPQKNEKPQIKKNKKGEKKYEGYKCVLDR